MNVFEVMTLMFSSGTFLLTLLAYLDRIYKRK